MAERMEDGTADRPDLGSRPELDPAPPACRCAEEAKRFEQWWCPMHGFRGVLNDSRLSPAPGQTWIIRVCDHCGDWEKSGVLGPSAPCITCEGGTMIGFEVVRSSRPLPAAGLSEADLKHISVSHDDDCPASSILTDQECTCVTGGPVLMAKLESLTRLASDASNERE